MSNVPTPLDLADIQGIVLFAYASLPEACYLHASFAAQTSHLSAWLGDILGEVRASSADGDRGDQSRVNVGLTASGLLCVGLDEAELATFPRELRHGMNNPLRARVLGDVGESAPEAWEFGGTTQPAIDAVLMLFAKDEATLAALRQRQLVRIRERGGVVVHEDRARVDDHEPFGFRDGLEQPHVVGSPRPRPPHASELPAGEFILGHANAYGEMPPVPRGRGNFPLGQNGTYLVYRKLAQDVAKFWQSMRTLANEDAHDAGPDEGAGDGATRTTDDPIANNRRAVALAARLVGRWPSGAPLVHYPDHDVGDGAFRSDFGYDAEDRAGLRCPIGAHVRRANPRDSLEPDPETSRVSVDRHRILRRGRVYGPPARPGALVERADETATKERGLVFIALNASIRRQFEFIQQTWLNNPKFGGLYDERDPLVSVIDDTDPFTIPRDPVRKRIFGIQRFITVRGGAYFFLPGIRALEWLAARL